MALNPKVSAAARNAEANSTCGLLDGGTVKIYTGTQPATPETAVGVQVLLSTLTFGTPAFGAAVAGIATANAIAEAAIGATGTAAWFRAATSGGTAVFDGTVGVADSPAPGDTYNMLVGTTAFQSGALARINSLTYTRS